LFCPSSVDYILFITAPVTLQPNENEVCDVKWVDATELKNLMNELDRESSQLREKEKTCAGNSCNDNLCPSTADAFTPWFKLIASKFLIPWWDKLLERRTSNSQSTTADSSENVVDAKSLKDFQDNEIHRML
jgi:isopentenyl-diphosphate delta-isomerase